MRLTDTYISQATEAMRASEFPLIKRVVPEEPGSVPVTNREHYGLEGLMPVTFFDPQVYDQVKQYGKSAVYNAQDHWFNNVHAMAVLETTYGYHAKRAVTHVLVEAMYLARHQHKADTIITASRMFVRGEVEPSLWLAVWDDGTQYVSPEHMQHTFAEDGFGVLNGDRKFPVEDNKNIGPTVIAKDVFRVFHGDLKVVSGQNVMELGYDEDEYKFRFSKIAPIAGNLLVARLGRTETPDLKKPEEQ